MNDPLTTGSISNICQQEHFVQFYREDSSLIDNLKSFIDGGLLAGETCLVVGTAEHLAGLNDGLRAGGINVEDCLETGQYIALDADEQLPKIMFNDLPGRGLFAHMADELLGEAIKSSKGIRVFGEMVALLWASDKQAGAILLEKLCSEITRSLNVTLFCAYPMEYFSKNADSSSLIEISQLHSTTISARPTIVDNDYGLLPAGM